MHGVTNSSRNVFVSPLQGPCNNSTMILLEMILMTLARIWSKSAFRCVARVKTMSPMLKKVCTGIGTDSVPYFVLSDGYFSPLFSGGVTDDFPELPECDVISSVIERENNRTFEPLPTGKSTIHIVVQSFELGGGVFGKHCFPPI